MTEQEIIVNQVPEEQPPIVEEPEPEEEPKDEKKSKFGILDDFCEYLDGDEL